MVKYSRYLKTYGYISPLLVSLIIILLPVIIGSGCHDSEGGSDKVSSPPAISRKIFVTSSTGDKVSVFGADNSGNVSPIRSIESKARLSNPQGVFVDTVNNEIFVTNMDSDSITVFTRTASGDDAPMRVIEGDNTGLFFPGGIFVDTKNNEIFVLNIDSITVYERTDEGDVNPKRIIQGENTELFLPTGLYVDTTNDEIFVGSLGCDGDIPVGAILVFQRTDDGDLPPVRSIKISETTDEGFPFLPTSVYLDSEHDELFVADFSTALLSNCPFIIPALGIQSFPIHPALEASVKVFDRESSGEAKPLRTIRGPGTGLANPFGIAIDSESDSLFILNSFHNTITLYNRNDKGDIQPLRTLSISDANHAGFQGERSMSFGISLDTENDEVLVANRNNTITVYRVDAELDEPPLRVIGSITGLLKPGWIYVDTSDNQIFVMNSFSRLITVHGVTDEGNISPLRTIPQDEVFAPQGMFVDKENGEIYLASIFGTNEDLESIVNIYTLDGNFKRSIFGPKTELSIPQGVFVDTKNEEIFVANVGDAFDDGDDEITVYRMDASGDQEPLRRINNGLSSPNGIFVDTDNNELFVASSGNDTITVYRRDASEANDEPIRTINTGLSIPQGIFVDKDNDEIFVTNLGNSFIGEQPKITVYRRQAGEGEGPLRTIEGPNTGLDGPFGIFVAESP